MAVKGLVLAAGLGNRLKPLTDRWPKPLVPFLGAHPLILALWRLKQAGITDIAINTHHLAPQIAEFAKSKPFGLQLHLAHEPDILGTGGVYNPLRTWLGTADLVVLNGDVVSDMPVAPLVTMHQTKSALATMAVLGHVLPGEAGVHHKNGQIVGIGKQPIQGAAAGNFACAQVLSPKFLDRLPKSGAFDVIAQGYVPCIAEKAALFTHVYAGYWHDMGNQARYLAAVHEALSLDDKAWAAIGLPDCHTALGRTLRRIRGQSLVDATAKIGAGSRLGPNAVVENDAVIGTDVHIEHATILPNARITDGQSVSNTIIC